MTERLAFTKLGLDKVLKEGVLKEFGKESIEAGAKQLAKKKITKDSFNDAIKLTNRTFSNKLKDALAGGGKGILIEGTQEFSQSYIEESMKQVYDNIFAEDAATPGKGKFGADITSFEQFKNASQEAFFGAIIGAGMGAGSMGLTPVSTESTYHYVDNAVRKGEKDKVGSVKEQALKAKEEGRLGEAEYNSCLLYTSPSPRD